MRNLGVFSGRHLAAWRGPAAGYPADAPFHPGPGNELYRGVEECFRLAGLDAAGNGQPDWNPLGDWIAPGETVLLKPNWVKVEHPRETDGSGHDWQSVVTHPALIRAMADYCFRAVGPSGRVWVADAPQTDSSWALIRERLALHVLAAHYRRQGLDFTVFDLRKEEWRAAQGVIVERRALPGDPLGYVAFDLAGASEFARHRGEGRYYGADYDEREVNRHHSGGRHEYLLARTAVAADVVISMPKLKTHKKTGITAGLKNLVGVNGDKNWLPHHTECGWRAPGDERPAAGRVDELHRLAERTAVRWLRRASLRWPGVAAAWHQRARRAGAGLFGDTESVVRSGNWSGNDTCWRMCLDLNKLVFYGRPDGSLRRPGAASRKRYFVLADGWTAGEGSGPMNPDPVASRLLLLAAHPATADAGAALLMGFDPERIPLVRQAFRVEHFRLTEWDWPEIEVVSNVAAWSRPLAEIDPGSTFAFRPHFGWQGSIERQPAATSLRPSRSEVVNR